MSNRTCEVERRNGSFMTLGPRLLVRCQNGATMIVYEKDYKRGKAGKMKMCDACYAIFLKMNKRPHAIKKLKVAIACGGK